MKTKSSQREEAKNSINESSKSPRPAQVQVERWGEQTPEYDPFETVESACEEVKRLIGWLDYVAESEYTATERDKLIAAAKKFAGVAQPIASKYID